MSYTGWMKPMSDAAKRLDEIFTYGDYRRWPEEERWGRG